MSSLLLSIIVLHCLVFKVQFCLDFCSEGAFATSELYMCMRACKSAPYVQKDSQNGGDEEDRTPDPLLARQVLSQLSYTPIYLSVWIFRRLHVCSKRGYT